MADKIIVREAVTLEGIVYPPGWEIPLEVWLRVPVKERNMLLNTGKVEERDECASGSCCGSSSVARCSRYLL